MSNETLTIPRPDDWHAHLRDGPVLSAVIGASARVFKRIIVMPNLRPPVTTADDAAAYRARIIAEPDCGDCVPLMTCYLTDNTDAAELVAGHRDGIFTAAKLYPAGATTNSDQGVTRLDRVYRVIEAMEDNGIPLLIHGEVVDEAIDVFDREAVFIDRHLAPLIERFGDLKVVLEHVTTRQGVDFVTNAGPNVAATITPHHLMFNRNAMFKGGIRPHFYCLPIAKREDHRLALRAAATSGSGKFFLGTDTAPHVVAAKETACGCAGVYNAPTAMACYAQVFDEENALDRLAGFASEFGADFYGLPRNAETLVLQRTERYNQVDSVVSEPGAIAPFVPDEGLVWRVAE